MFSNFTHLEMAVLLQEYFALILYIEIFFQALLRYNYISEVEITTVGQLRRRYSDSVFIAKAFPIGFKGHEKPTRSSIRNKCYFA